MLQSTILWIVFALATSVLPPSLWCVPAPFGTGAADEDATLPAIPSGDPAVPGRQKITTFLWFDQNAEEAVKFYVSVFKNSKVLRESRWGEGGPAPKGALMTASFQLEGQEFMAMNGGPHAKFTEAVSLFVSCETQAEVDEYWAKLGEGREGQCGWIKDRYGLSWQIIPAVLGELLADQDPAKVKRVTEAMLQMKKLDIERLKQAAGQR